MASSSVPGTLSGGRTGYWGRDDGGLGAVLFREMITGFALMFHGVNVVNHSAWRAGIPAVGLMLAGLITHFFAREVKGHGVPQLLESLALRGGRIRSRVAIFGILAPAITIGAGGSVGREGPIALIGGSFGSVLGQWLRLSDKYISLLLACGAAAGIAATFNAPIAGAFFGLEIILGSYALGAIMPVFLSAVTGATVFDSIMGNYLAPPISHYTVIHPVALVFMILLGFLAGFVGIGYSKGLTISEDLLDKWKVPFWVKNVTGGLVIGIIGLWVPQVLGVGYSSIHRALIGGFGALTLILLLVFKYIATLTTVGSGGSGGVFAPSLFLGSVLGALYGDGLRSIFPQVIPHPEIYAVAGMGAIFAAAAQAPFVAITILLKVTGDYQLTPVVMAACVTAYVVHGVLTRDSMYTVKLSRRGIRILRGNEVRPTQSITVAEAMESPQVLFFLGESVESAFRKLSIEPTRVGVFRDEKSHFAGLITLDDLRAALEQGRGTTPLSQFSDAGVPILEPEDTLDTAMRRCILHNASVLPVVHPQTQEVMGLITERDIIRAYDAFTSRSVELTAKIQQLREIHENAGEFVQVKLIPPSPAIGQPLMALHLPAAAVVVSVKRMGKLVVPHGGTILQKNDDVLVFITPVNSMESVLSYLNGQG